MYRDRALPKLSTEKFKKEVTTLVEQELAKTLVSIEDIVHAEVTRLVPKMIPAMLGLKTSSWHDGGFEIASGRDAHPVGLELANAMRDKAQEVVSEALKDWTPPKGVIAAARTEYNRRMDYAVGEAASVQAARDAEEWAVTFVNDVLDGKFDTPGRPTSSSEKAQNVLRDIAEGRLKGAKAVKAAAEVLGEEAS
jgi:hypothetical protein